MGYHGCYLFLILSSLLLQEYLVLNELHVDLLVGERERERRNRIIKKKVEFLKVSYIYSIDVFLSM